MAVAGSGKTTTMVLRIRELLSQGVDPKSILVLMFNRLARDQFAEKLSRFGVSEHQNPHVHTFHSFAHKLIREKLSRGLLPRTTELWTGDKEELYRIYVLRAIDKVRIDVKNGRLNENTELDIDNLADPEVPAIDLDPGEVKDAIGLWKGSLIPPSRAGYHGNPYIPLVYAEFEKIRNQKNAITFDDFVPIAVEELLADSAFGQQFRERYDHLIVDEYQDINYGQQRLVELLASKRADVMVVGDDDQTIYEWRGARPSYMILRIPHGILE